MQNRDKERNNSSGWDNVERFHVRLLWIYASYFSAIFRNGAQVCVCFFVINLNFYHNSVRFKPRKLILLVMPVFVLTSLLFAVCDSYETLMFSRLLQVDKNIKAFFTPNFRGLSALVLNAVVFHYLGQHLKVMLVYRWCKLCLLAWLEHQDSCRLSLVCFSLSPISWIPKCYET